jgi:hypothetical protein
MRLGELCHLKNGIHRPQEFSDQNRGRQRQQRPIHALPKELLTKWKPITDTTAPNLLLRRTQSGSASTSVAFKTPRKAMKDSGLERLVFPRIRFGIFCHASIKAMTQHHQGTLGQRDDHDLFAPSAKKRATLCSPLDFFIEIE